MLTEVVTAGPEGTIQDALALFERHGIRALPIVDAGGCLLGMFSFDLMLSNLLPKALQMESYELKNVDLRLDYLVDTEEDLAEQLRALFPIKLADLMDPDVRVAHPDTPLVEGIRLLTQYGSPIPVVEEPSRRLLGLLTVQCATSRLVALMRESG
jgi:CBS domain-containing protein